MSEVSEILEEIEQAIFYHAHGESIPTKDLIGIMLRARALLRTHVVIDKHTAQFAVDGYRGFADVMQPINTELRRLSTITEER